MSRVRDIARRLAAAGVPSPDVDARLLVEHVGGAGGVELSEAQTAQLADLVDQRCQRVPLQHLTGVAYFRYLTLQVGPGVFVPRPETEILVDIALSQKFESAIDIGTGSGAIAASLATESSARLTAVEADPMAIAWARRNLGDVPIVAADVCTDDLSGLGPVDLVVSNPPYIPRAMVPRDPEVSQHDPGRALYGGDDGLAVLRCVTRQATRLLNEGGRLLLEHGEEQAAAVQRILAQAGFEKVHTWADLTGRPRVTGGVWESESP